MSESEGVRWWTQPFEAGFLGGPVWRLSLGAAATAAGLARALQQARSEGVRLVACRVAAEEVEAVRLLEQGGFHRIETLITHERPVLDEPEPVMGPGIVLADAADRAPCVEIARQAFRYDRFHADPRIDPRAASALKAAWVDNGFAGRADAIVVARVDGRARGFVLCLRPEPTTAVIDLIATEPSWQGRGLGRALVLGTLTHYRGRAHLLRVGTQEANAGSLRLYALTGCRVVGRHHTFHWIPSP